MPFTLSPIPNSTGVSAVLSIFSYYFTFLKNARPLPQTAHAVTSVIKPQAGYSKTTPLLFLTGAGILIGAAYLFKTRFSPKPPPPDDISKKNPTVVTPPSGGASNQARGTGSPPSPVSNREEAEPPPPQVVNAAIVSAVPPAGSDQREAGLPAPVHVDVAPLPSNNEQPAQPLPPSPPLVPIDQPVVANPSPPPANPASDSPPPDEAPRRPAQPLARSDSSPAPSEGSSSSSSSDAIDPEDSDSDFEAQSQSPPQPSAVGSTVATVTNFITNTRHFSKWRKYCLIREQLEQFARNKKIGLYSPEMNATRADAEIADAWNNLVAALLNPTKFKTADEQYRATVECLRKILQKLVTADAVTKRKFSSQFQFVRELAYVRFAGIEIFPYCKELIELASKIPLPANLTLDTFQEELKTRATLLNKPDPSHGVNGAACQLNKARGTFGVDFDPLLKFIPYQDGEISINGRTTLLLWHGTPVSQHDPYGLAFELVAGALSYIPLLSRLVPVSNPVSAPPVINADYVAFIEHAAVDNKNILHVILENGKKQLLGDESARVKARLRLGIYNPNMFAMALRLDGVFFERHDIGHNAVESIQSLKGRLREQLLSPLSEAEDLSASMLQTKQMEDQLAANGFCIPQKLRQAAQLPEHMDRLLDEIHQIYFPGVENITTQEHHQAFLILSYVHIMLFICEKTKISILEALCKDDKDRGNVIKTIFKLHFLYLTGQISHESLTSVLVHTLARPFILQKNAIIKSRLVLLERVIPVIRNARNRTPVPKTFLFGGAVQNASYRVAKPPGQTIYPSNAASKTIEEYMAFLENPPATPIPCDNNLTKALSGSCYPEARLQDFIHCRALKDQLNRTFSNPLLEITIKLDGPPGPISPISMKLSNGKGIPKIKFDAIYSISDKNAVLARVKVSLTMADARSGQAQLTYAIV